MTPQTSTDTLIAQLAATPAPKPPALRPIGLTICAAILLGLLAFWLLLGFRADLGAALMAPVTLAKSVLPLMLAALALPLVLRAARPGARLALWPLWLPIGLAGLLLAARLMAVPAPQIGPEMLGQTAAACLLSVTLLSVAPMIAGVMMLRPWASTRPVLSGALIGLVSGAGAAAGYALHCTEDSPLFFVTWYGLAIALATGLGALLGHRYLRW